MDVLPPEEIIVYLNQVDLYSLVLTNKKLHILYQKYLDKIKKFSQKRGKIVTINCIQFIESHKTDGNKKIIIKVKINKETPFILGEYDDNEKKCTYGLSIIEFALGKLKIKLKPGDIIMNNPTESFPVLLYVVSDSTINDYPYSEIIYIPDNFANNTICGYYIISEFPIQNLSPYHLRSYSLIYTLSVPVSRVFFHPGSNYLEISYQGFRFRLQIMQNVLDITTSTPLLRKERYCILSILRETVTKIYLY